MNEEYDLSTESILKQRIIIYQHDLICCYEAKMAGNTIEEERIKQDKTVIDELKRIWYKQGLDGLVYTQ